MSKDLSPTQKDILLNKGTEMPFSGALLNNKETGMYVCGQCGAELFTSDTKYDSGSGWPSFTKAIADDVVTIETDYSHGMVREEVMCAQCGGHLGHRFPDGPQDAGGQRYCLNSAALNFNSEDGKTTLRGDGEGS